MGEEKKLSTSEDHDLLMRLDVRTENMEKVIGKIEAWMEKRPCPSNLCQEHAREIERLSTIVKVVGGVLAVAVPTLVVIVIFLLEQYMGG